MHIILSYIIKCVIASGILTGYYYVALRNKKFNAYNRVYLLAAIVVSLITPFIHIEWFTIQPPQNSALNTVFAAIANPPQQQSASFSTGTVCLLCAAAISVVLLIVLAARIVWIYRIKNKSTAVKMHGYDLIETGVKQAPFSFLDNLFWKQGIALNDAGWQKVLHHELVHIKQRHTYDKLFAQITVCIFWMNPFFWFIQRELTMIHEFIADAGCIKDGDTEAFAVMLLQAHNEGRYLSPQHSFFHSPIKRRLIMITTSKQTPYSYMRRVLAIPIAAVVVTLFSVTISHAQTDPKASPGPGKIKIIEKGKKVNANGDSVVVLKLALKQHDLGKVDSVSHDSVTIREIQILPATIKYGKIKQDSIGGTISFAYSNKIKDTIKTKNLESIQVTGKPAKIILNYKPNGGKDSNVNVIKFEPIDVVSKPLKTPAKQQ